ncbi:MAG TPA: serine hydrolase, partial [Flavobacteriales bacterium]|nr:serine hydrolase [Flavobacteriales bacterium]
MAQGIYFPPNTGGAWETVDPATLGWCVDQIPPLIDFLGTNNTKAFIVLKDGRIAIEHYFGTFTQDSVWYWASAGKSLTSTLVGKAQEEGFLDINEPSINYLGTGWTTSTLAQEAAITIRHQLTMTTGLDDSGDNNCTDPACLHYLADPGTRWAYHTGAYTKLDGVLNAATGQTINAYLFSKLTQTMGLTGLYITLDYDHVFFSTPRNMARFGLLAMNGGNWNGNQILNTTYFNEMVTPSQALNDSYGYLWWLNGQSSFMAPGTQIVFPGEIMPNEPAEAFNALGKNGQTINVVPSQGLVVIRMGDAPG